MLLAFKKEFELPIKEGLKTSTLRKQRQNTVGPGAKVGDPLHLMLGRYTDPDYKKIGVAEITRIRGIRILPPLDKQGRPADRFPDIWVDTDYNPNNAGYRGQMPPDQVLHLAKIEGFASVPVFFAFFEVEKKGSFVGWQYQFRLKEISDA